MVVAAIDGTIAALSARAEPDWAKHIAELELLRERTLRAAAQLPDPAFTTPVAEAS